MNNLLILIPVALGLGLLGLLAFVWTLKSGQYDDLEGAAQRILDDEDDVPLVGEKEERGGPVAGKASGGNPPRS